MEEDLRVGSGGRLVVVFSGLVKAADGIGSSDVVMVGDGLEMLSLHGLCMKPSLVSLTGSTFLARSCLRCCSGVRSRRGSLDVMYALKPRVLISGVSWASLSEVDELSDLGNAVGEGRNPWTARTGQASCMWLYGL